MKFGWGQFLLESDESAFGLDSLNLCHLKACLFHHTLIVIATVLKLLMRLLQLNALNKLFKVISRDLIRLLLDFLKFLKLALRRLPLLIGF